MKNLFEERYDVIVVGGGPGGSTAARTAAQGGLKTLMLEKDRDIGIPVRCAEGVSLERIKSFIEIDNKFIDDYIHTVRFIAPSGIALQINVNNEIGVVLNRKVFDLELAKLAASAGANVFTRCCVTGIRREGKLIEVMFEHFGKLYSAKTNILIGADGVETMVGRWAGLKTRIPLTDIETCYQYLLFHPDIKEGCSDFYFGNEVAPGGYLWIFPKGGNCANVGLGINYSRAKGKLKHAKEFLDKFIHKKYPGASILSSIAGSVPSARVPKRIVDDNVMLVGDAALQADPLTGGGIASAIIAGKHAGKTAIDAHNKGDFSQKLLNKYHKLWHNEIGKRFVINYRLKLAVFKLTDDTFNRAAVVLNKIPFEERSLTKVFQTALSNEPKLMMDIIKAFLK